MILAMLILQATAADPATLLQGVEFDLRKPPAPTASGNDVVVTGRRLDHRLPALPEIPPEPVLPRAETGIFRNGTLGVTVDQVMMPGNVPSNRAMLTLKIGL